MAINYELLNKGGISLGTNFELLSEKPLDSRLVVPSLDGLQNYIDNAAAYEGLIAYVSSEKKHYEVKVIDGVLSYRPFGLTEAELNDLITNATTAAMEFKGATATLPENPAKGDMYKVAGENINIKIDDVDAKLGDSIVYDGEKWFLIPSGDDIEDTWRPVEGVNNDATLKFVDGDKTVAAVAADGTIKYNHATVAAPADVTAEGDEKTRTYITAVETDGYGHITGYKTATENVEDTNTEYTFESQVESSSVYFNVTANTEGATEETIYVDAYSKNEAEGKFVAKEEGKSLVSDDEIARLADVDNYDDEEVRGLIGDNAKAIEDLETYVGTIPTDEKYADVKTVISYVNKKAEETLAAAQGGSSETAASVKQQLDNYKSENDTRVKAAEDAIDAIEEDSHTHANKDLLDTYTQTEANLADAVAKKHAHTFVEAELNKIADGDVAKWNAAEQNANKYTDDAVVALGLSSDDANLIVTNKNVVVHGDIVAQGYEDDELGPQGGTIRAESFYSTAENCYLATSNAVETAIDVANRYTDNLGTVDADNTKITIDKDVYLYSKQVGSEEFAYVNLYIDDNKVATEVAVDEKIDALDLANTYQPKGDYAAEEHTHTKDEITDFAHTHVAADITDLDSTIKGYDYATKTELDKKADKTQVATDIANAIAPLATTEALNGVKATAEAATTVEEVDAQIDAKIGALNLGATYEPIGAENRAKAYVDGKFTDANLDQYTTEQEVKDIVDDVIKTATSKETLDSLVELVEYIDAHSGDAINMATAIGVLEGKVEVIEEKPAYGITATQISNWDNEVGAKALAETKLDASTFTEYSNAHASDYTNKQIDDAIDADVKTAIDAEVLRADGKYEEKGVAQGIVDGLKLSETYEPIGAETRAIAAAKTETDNQVKALAGEGNTSTVKKNADDIASLFEQMQWGEF